jgi:diguanylate cyclase
MPTPPSAKTSSDEKSLHIAQQAMQLMQQHRVDPVPEHYAVWYAYAQGNDAQLKKDIDQAIRQRVPFTRDIMTGISRRFTESQKNQVLQESTQGAQALLTDALRLMTEFGGETSAYNRQLDTNVQALSATAADARPVQDIVQAIIERARAVRDSGAALQKKLEDSTREIATLKTNLEKVSAESQRDFLTGLYNRKALDSYLEAALREAKDQREELCALMIDIDHFKQFNDKFGHLIGDEVLKIVARSLTQSVKGKDYVARYGGEEFCVLLPATPLQGGMVVAEALRKFVAGNNLVRKDTGEKIASITVSIGVARLRPEHDTAASLLARADEALYRAKKEGRNRVSQEA